MQIPNISDNEFLNAITFNDLFSAVKTSLQEQNEGNMVPGLISPGSLVFSFSGLTVNVDAPLPFRVGFNDGVLAKAMGTADGQNTTNYSIDFSSFVPSSGSSTVYLLAETVQIQQDPFTVIGPPPGHPNYDPAFSPYLTYSTLDDSLNLFASTTAADNKTTFELGRVTLAAGQTAITSIDTSHQTYATSLLNPTGVASGTYTFPQLTIDPDGRILSATENTDIALTNGNNSFTGNNSFSNPVVIANATASDEALSLGQADSLFAALNGSSSENFATDALTSSGLITANGGLTVPSGETETVNGTLDATGGTVEVANATANNQPVALGQVINTKNIVGISNTTNSGTSISATTPTFTAPCDGYLLILTMGGNTNPDSNALSLSTSLGGSVNLYVNDDSDALVSSREDYQVMTTGQSTTITASQSNATAVALSVAVFTVWVPNP